MDGRRLLGDRVSMFIVFIYLSIIWFIMGSLWCVAQARLPWGNRAAKGRGGVFGASTGTRARQRWRGPPGSRDRRW